MPLGDLPRWQIAQKKIRDICAELGFTVHEEYPVPHGRIDLYLWKRVKNHKIIGALEVKDYANLTRSIEKKALQQLLKYVLALIKKETSLQALTVFAGVVLTNSGVQNLRVLPTKLVISKLQKPLDPLSHHVLTHTLFFITGIKDLGKAMSLPLISGLKQTSLQEFLEDP